MEPQCRPLLATLHDIPDPRQARGRRHPLAAILALMCVAMLCGYRSYSAIADWGRCYGQKLARALGFTHAKTPCAATLHHVLRQLDGPLMEAARRAWAESVLAVLPPAVGELEALAIDGKTLRGSRKQGAPAVHLLAVLSHRLGLTVGPQAVADKTNEIPVLEDMLRGLVVEGRVMTMDALLTQRAIAERIVQGGGDYVMLVKGNQPQLQHDIQLVFHEAQMSVETMATVETVGQRAWSPRAAPADRQLGARRLQRLAGAGPSLPTGAPRAHEEERGAAPRSRLWRHQSQPGPGGA